MLATPFLQQWVGLALNGNSGHTTTMDTCDTQDGRLSVYLCTRSDQHPQDVLQALLW